MRFSVLNSVAV